MGKLEELIDAICPEGVKYIPIGELVDYEQPGKYIVKNTDYSDNFSIPVLTAGQTFILGYTNETKGIYPASVDDPVIIFDDFTGAFKWVDFPFKVKSSAMKMLKTKGDTVSLRYVFHLMGWLNYTSSEHKRLWISIYSQLRVPVPPVEIQNEVVRILDKFTSLSTELTTELVARKKQYSYYKDLLITANKDAEIKKIQDICEISRGKVISKDYIRDNLGEYPVYSSQTENNGELGRISSYMYDGEYLTWTTDGANAGSVFYRNGKFNITNVCGLLKVTSPEVDIRYLYHVLTVEAPKYVNSGMGNPKLMSNVMGGIKVHIPKLDKQAKIISALDRFEAIYNDPQYGIPVEIQARKKQYMYYRDKLLTFKELKD